MKKLLIVLIILTLSAPLFSGDFSDNKMATFFSSLKKGQYEKGIVALLSDSILEEKIVNVTQNLNNWISQFTQIHNLYGDYLSYDKVFTVKLGNMEESTYLVYCTDYPIQIVITEYFNGSKTQLINLYFDDSTMDTLAVFGEMY
jgi:hypothetical protein